MIGRNIHTFDYIFNPIKMGSAITVIAVYVYKESRYDGILLHCTFKIPTKSLGNKNNSKDLDLV